MVDIKREPTSQYDFYSTNVPTADKLYSQRRQYEMKRHYSYPETQHHVVSYYADNVPLHHHSDDYGDLVDYKTAVAPASNQRILPEADASCYEFYRQTRAFQRQPSAQNAEDQMVYNGRPESEPERCGEKRRIENGHVHYQQRYVDVDTDADRLKKMMSGSEHGQYLEDVRCRSLVEAPPSTPTNDRQAAEHCVTRHQQHQTSSASSSSQQLSDVGRDAVGLGVVASVDRQTANGAAAC
jgi:hypothetical protein